MPKKENKRHEEGKFLENDASIRLKGILLEHRLLSPAENMSPFKQKSI